ncbi:ectonucleoside triphosphate diphosphohydrolase 2 isoform X2 [Archocentrus centrarchus]|uniref:ectonucleoside triphosphate diphosphohydrolase 2 isoform X2 n=1 Tax=Archocentrus centrarchus TaxID=63155 RepID=UPI0011E9B670|nr:ectonucleoside triphosphate diphosphohydrolase 2 isoform X2 [Archocentrus centrarchus]
MAQRAAHLVPVAVLVCGLVGILLLTIPTKDVQEEPGLRYGIVLDAGSSHTSLYIYKWPGNKQNGTAVVTQHSKCHAEGGGIASYAGQLGAAGKSLEACLDHAVKNIPKDRHQLTPVYLGATAGMRLLHLSSPELSAQILKEVSHKIQSYPFDYRGAAILSGKEEGAYGWVTVNYLSENFIKYGFEGHWFSPSRPTVGALDLGGASTQITFATQEKIEDTDDLMKLRLYGHKYTLYTHSFLCYGKDQFLKRLLAHIMKAFSAFFYVHSFLQQVTGITASSPLELEVATKRVCNMSFSQMTLLAPEQKSRLHYYCAASVFLNALMLRGYGFNDTSFPHISFQKKVADTTVGWALGYMLSLSNLLPTERLELRKALTPGVWGSLIFLFVLLLAAVLVFFLFRAFNGQKKGGRESTI